MPDSVSSPLESSTISKNLSLTEAYRQILNQPEYAHARLNFLQPFVPDSQRYLDAFGSTEKVQHLTQQFPIALAVQAEPIQPAHLADLSVDALTEMVDTKRQSLFTRRAELQTMQAQISEKRRQIELLHSLIETQIHCIRLSQSQLEEVEMYVQARNINIEDRLEQKYQTERAREEMIIAAEGRGIWVDDDSAEDAAMAYGTQESRGRQ